MGFYVGLRSGSFSFFSFWTAAAGGDIAFLGLAAGGFIGFWDGSLIGADRGL
jgi:hypothetical protein